MPVRVFAKLLTLYLACFGIIGLAAAVGAELYIFPLKGRITLRPPSSPWQIAIYLACCGILYPLSQRCALYFFTGWTFLMPLGSLFGWGMFSWTPSWAQHLLTVVMILTSAYGWCIRDDCMDR